MITIEKNRLTANEYFKVILDLDIYDIEYTTIKNIEYLTIPGNIKIEGRKISHLKLPYSINLLKNGSFTEYKKGSSKFISIEYDKGDVFIVGEYKKSETNIKMVDALFDNRVLTANTSIATHINELWTQLSGASNISLHHLEVILSCLYGDEDQYGNMKYTRLVNKIYDHSTKLSVKESIQEFQGMNAVQFGYIDDAIENHLSKRNKIHKNSNLENIISGEYYKLGKNNENK